MKGKIKANFDLSLDEIGKAKAKKVLFRASVKIQELAKQKVRVNTADLRRSITLEPKTPGSSTYLIFSNLNYAAPTEYGSKPHAVPYAPLVDWARKKFGEESIGYAVANKIKKEGTSPHPYMRPALDQVRTQELRKIVRSEFNK